MGELNYVTQSDVDFLVEQTKWMQDDEKLKYVFDWFVDNWSYGGYSKGMLCIAAEHLDSINSLNGLVGGKRASNLTEFEREKTGFKFEGHPSALRLNQYMVSWFRNLSENDISMLVQNNPLRKDILENMSQLVEQYKSVFEDDDREKIVRDIFLKKQGKKYVGTCGDFAKQFEIVCENLDLKKQVILCTGEIHNGVCFVGHSFNAVVDEENGDVKYIDISFAIHAREQAEGFRSVGEQFNCENRYGFFLKTREEIAKAEGKERKYDLPDTARHG